jgi:hypothetical protein
MTSVPYCCWWSTSWRKGILSLVSRRHNASHSQFEPKKVLFLRELKFCRRNHITVIVLNFADQMKWRYDLLFQVQVLISTVWDPILCALAECTSTVFWESGLRMVQWTETCRQVFNIDYQYMLCYWLNKLLYPHINNLSSLQSLNV